MTGPSAKTGQSTADDQRRQMSFRVWQYRMGEIVSLMIHLGDRLGLYRALNDLRGTGPVSAADLARHTNLNQRLIAEWLLGQAAAGLVDRSGPDAYELNDHQAAVLADEQDSADFAAGAFEGGVDAPTIAALVDSFKTGQGLTYEQKGETAAVGQARSSGPRQRLELGQVLVDLGLDQLLVNGADVVEIGCGAGVGLTELASRYPATAFTGLDPSPTAIALGQAAAAKEALTNITFDVAYASELAADSVDCVMAFDCLHDMPRPDLALAAAASALADDGVMLVKEIRSTGDFELDSRNPLLAMFYGFSVSSCLQSAMSEPDGLELGTLGLHPERMTELLNDAGFANVDVHDSGDPAHLFYLARR